MKKRIDPVAILSVGEYVKNQSEQLKIVKNKLLENINKISDCYHGKDADIIISKYQNRVNNLDSIIVNYENYALYMQKIADAYANNLSDSKQKLNKVLEISSDNNIEITLSNIENIK